MSQIDPDVLGPYAMASLMEQDKLVRVLNGTEMDIRYVLPNSVVGLRAGRWVEIPLGDDHKLQLDEAVKIPEVSAAGVAAKLRHVVEDLCNGDDVRNRLRGLVHMVDGEAYTFGMLGEQLAAARQSDVHAWCRQHGKNVEKLFGEERAVGSLQRIRFAKIDVAKIDEFRVDLAESVEKMIALLDLTVDRLAVVGDYGAEAERLGLVETTIGLSRQESEQIGKILRRALQVVEPDSLSKLAELHDAAFGLVANLGLVGEFVEVSAGRSR